MQAVVCPELVGTVLSLLPDVRIVAPYELREAVQSAAREVLIPDWDPRSSE